MPPRPDALSAPARRGSSPCTPCPAAAWRRRAVTRRSGRRPRARNGRRPEARGRDSDERERPAPAGPSPSGTSTRRVVERRARRSAHLEPASSSTGRPRSEAGRAPPAAARAGRCAPSHRGRASRRRVGRMRRRAEVVREDRVLPVCTGNASLSSRRCLWRASPYASPSSCRSFVDPSTAEACAPILRTRLLER